MSREIWIAPRTDGVAGTGTAADPYDGGTASKFDALMVDPQNGVRTTIRLTEGVFATRGYSDAGIGSGVGWQPKPGWRIVGAGIFLTTLRLVEATGADSAFFAIGNKWFDPASRLDGFEVSDLTVDCNLAGQPIPAGLAFAPVACGAILAGGRHVRIRRVRAINFGTQTAKAECFVISSAWAHADVGDADDCVIEDCIAEQPALDNVRETTVLHMGASERYTRGRADAIMAFHSGCAIRRCVVDCEYRLNPSRIAAISIPDAEGISTVTTQQPHGLTQAGQWIRINGARVEGAPGDGLDHGYNGAFATVAIASPTSFVFRPNNPEPTAEPTGEMWLGRWPSQYVALAAIESRSEGAESWEVIITTATAHFLVPGSRVSVNYVNQGTGGSPINGLWVVNRVVDRKRFAFEMSTNPGSVTPLHYAFIGVGFQGLSIDGGWAAVAEGNTIGNCRIGGPWHDTFSTRGLIVRNNRYRAVVTGPYQNMGGLTGAATTPFTLTPSLTLTHVGAIATLTVDSGGKPHGFNVGQAVQVQQTRIGNEDAPPGTYNGIYSITAVPSDTSFSYRMDVIPPADAIVGSARFRALWQVVDCVIENNVIELVPSINNAGTPVGISFLAAPPPAFQAFRVFRRIVIRNNIIRYVEGRTEPFARNLGIDLNCCENVLVEHNVIDLRVEDPIRHRNSDSVWYFHNTRASGRLILGAHDPAPLVKPRIKEDEPTTEVRDASILGVR